MAWEYLYRTADGALLSESSDPIAPVPEGCAVHSRVTRADARTEVWDATTRAFLPRANEVTRVITKYRFMARVGLSVLAAIEGRRAQGDHLVAALLTWLQMASSVDLDDPNLVAGLQYLVSLDLPGADAAWMAAVLADAPAAWAPSGSA